MLISVLDGKGFTSDSGMCGQRGYEESIIFNWIGATTPLPAKVHRMMSQLGTRLLLYEVPVTEPTEEELIAYASKDEAGAAEGDCRRAVNSYLEWLFKTHPIGELSPKDIVIGDDATLELVRLARLVTHARAEVKREPNDRKDWIPIGAGTPEGPWKVVNYLKELARGHAIVEGRRSVEEPDLAFVAHVAFSSVPGHIRAVLRQLARAGEIDSTTYERNCGVSRPTARTHLLETALLGLAERDPGSRESNEPDHITLAKEWRWLTDLEI